MLSRWVGTLPKDASFKRVPVGLGHPEWEALAKAYYALQATGDVDRLDSQIFEDIHKNHVWLYDEASITAWLGKHGVNVAKFHASNSPVPGEGGSPNSPARRRSLGAAAPRLATRVGGD